jgi:hypothetical protein
VTFQVGTPRTLSKRGTRIAMQLSPGTRPLRIPYAKAI